MTGEAFGRLEAYMGDCMTDAAHDREHVYRVLYTALELAGETPGADLDILTAAALLHDIGREAQLRDSSLCHAEVGGDMAFAFLLAEGWDQNRATHVRDCIRSHRFRTDRQPTTLEAKLLFDADKLDVTGAIGIARTLFYGGAIAQPLYQVDENGRVRTEASSPPSFFREYNYKLRGIADTLYTEGARVRARARQGVSDAFYDALLAEVSQCRAAGRERLKQLL